MLLVFWSVELQNDDWFAFNDNFATYNIGNAAGVLSILGICWVELVGTKPLKCQERSSSSRFKTLLL